MLTFISKTGMFKSDTLKVTNNIAIPKKNGQGQYGTSRFATDKEFDKAYEKLKFNKK